MILFAESDGGIVLTGVWILSILAGAGGVIAYLFRALVTAKDELIATKERAHQLALEQIILEKKEEESRKKSYQEIASEAIKSAIETANFYRQRDGKPPIIPPIPVVSEAHSPSTPQQRETAAIATMRAAMVAVKSATGQEARPEPEHAPVSPGATPPTPASVPVSSSTLSEVLGIQREIREVPARTVQLIEEQQDKNDSTKK